MRIHFTKNLPIRIVSDALIVASALAIACAADFLRAIGVGREQFSTWIAYVEPIAAEAIEPMARVAFQHYLSILFWILPIALVIFAAYGFYGQGRAYRGRFRMLVLIQAGSLIYIVFAAASYVSRFTVPSPNRTIFVLAWVLTVALLCLSRVWSGLWRDTVRTEDRLLRMTSRREIARVAVVGGAGYIGSPLVRQLLARGYTVKVMDSLVYGDRAIADLYGQPRFEFVKGDLRSVQDVVSALADVDAVVHLGAIVGDSACALDESLTIEINLAATRMLAEIAKGYGIRRFVFASTCSVYGSSDVKLDESSNLNPVSLYARTKIACEQVLQELSGPQFCPVILRLSTIYGLAPRPRFDLVVNLLSAKAVQDGEFTVFGGDQWRPFIHVSDAAQALRRALEADEDEVRCQIINIGFDDENYQIKQIGDLVLRHVPAAKMLVNEQDADRRNYWVHFGRATQVLGLEKTKTVEEGVREIVEAMRSGLVADYRDPAYNNFSYLSGIGKIGTMKLPESIFNTARTEELAMTAPGPRGQ